MTNENENHPSEPLRQMLRDHGFIAEIDVSDLKGEKYSTTRIKRSRGEMPPHFKLGGLICNAVDDIIGEIKSNRIVTAAAQRRTAGADLLA
ncbi:MAG: hypothetical protein ABJX32_09005 [Tateyamaria sp.]|uniref:hypothetical protein n=1 Tax=Tateyamaria sp. TaxID=1929288 RepID=UPI00329CEFA4